MVITNDLVVGVVNAVIIVVDIIIVGSSRNLARSLWMFYWYCGKAFCPP